MKIFWSNTRLWSDDIRTWDQVHTTTKTIWPRQFEDLQRNIAYGSPCLCDIPKFSGIFEKLGLDVKMFTLNLSILYNILVLDVGRLRGVGILEPE